MDLKTDFESYWTTINAGTEFEDRKNAAREEWMKHPEKQEPIMRWLNKHGAYPGRNPFFFIQDFKIRVPKVPQRQPVNYRGQAIPSGVVVFSAKYNNAWGMYTQQDIDDFHMDLPAPD